MNKKQTTHRIWNFRLELLYTFDYGTALKSEFGVSGQDIVNQLGESRKFGFTLQFSRNHSCYHDHLQENQRCCKEIWSAMFRFKCRSMLYSAILKLIVYALFLQQRIRIVCQGQVNPQVCHFALRMLQMSKVHGLLLVRATCSILLDQSILQRKFQLSRC